MHLVTQDRAMAVSSNEDMVPASELCKAEQRIRELERALGRKEMEFREERLSGPALTVEDDGRRRGRERARERKRLDHRRTLGQSARSTTTATPIRQEMRCRH